VLDRFIQQAWLQALHTGWEKSLSAGRCGCRPEHSASQAVAQAPQSAFMVIAMD
jgi:retron-type reverse transcriptase